MTTTALFGLCGAVLIGIGLYGLIVHPQPLRKILSFNLVGSGVFLLFGVVARRGAAQNRLDALDQQSLAERLGDEIVGTHLETEQLVDFFIL